MFDQKILGVDIGTWSVKFAELTAGLRDVEFTRFEELVLPPGAESEEVEATIALFCQQRALPLESVVTAFDTRHVTQRHLRFPFSGRKKIAPAIRFEIEEELPIDLEDTLTTFDTVRARSEQTDVLVAIASREEVERYLEAMHRMEIEPAVIDIEGATLANLSRFLGLDDVTRVVLDVGHTKTNLALLVDGHPISLRRLPVAGRHLTEALAEHRQIAFDAAEDQKHLAGVFEPGSTKPISAGVRSVLDRLAREALRSVQAVVSDPMDPLAPAEILLVGGSARLSGLAGYLEERTGMPCRTPEVPESVSGASALADAGVATYAQAAALALRGARTERATEMDLRQGEFAYTPDLSGMRGQLQLCVALFGVLLVLWMGSSFVAYQAEQHKVDRLQEEIASVHAQLFPDEPVPTDALAGLDAAARETRELADHLGVTGGGYSVLDILRELAARKPPGLEITLDEVRIERRSITGRGHSNDFVSTDRLKSAYAGFDGFQRVTITNIQNDTRRGGKVFNLNIRLDDGS